jgi:hypothetical protein
MNEDFVSLAGIIEGRESDPDRYQMWDRACRDQLGESIDTVAMDAPIMVPEHGFAYHAKFMAEEGGLVKDEWPYTYIDWEKAGQELMKGYDSVTVGGIVYYFGGTR